MNIDNLPNHVKLRILENLEYSDLMAMYEIYPQFVLIVAADRIGIDYGDDVDYLYLLGLPITITSLIVNMYMKKGFAVRYLMDMGVLSQITDDTILGDILYVAASTGHVTVMQYLFKNYNVKDIKERDIALTALLGQYPDVTDFLFNNKYYTYQVKKEYVYVLISSPGDNSRAFDIMINSFKMPRVTTADLLEIYERAYNNGRIGIIHILLDRYHTFSANSDKVQYYVKRLNDPGLTEHYNRIWRQYNHEFKG